MASRHAEALFTTDSYVSHRLDRTGKKGGGVCMLTRNQLQARRRVLQKELELAETVWFRVCVTELYYVCICLCYLSPKPRFTSAALIATLNEHLI